MPAKLLAHAAVFALLAGLVLVSGCVQNGGQNGGNQSGGQVTLPTMTITSSPSSANASQAFTVGWKAEGASGTFTQAGIRYGPTSVTNPANPTDYPSSSSLMCTVTPCSVPNSFSVQFSVATPGTYYFRAYALFNGSSVWSDERTITITQAQAGPPVNQSAPQTYDVTIQNFAFSPANLSIKAGDTVRWTNRDSTAYHTVTSDSGGSELISDVLGDGASFSHKFTTAGTFPYHCSIHTSMKGTITVV